jgi:hypothetical protein
VGNHQRIAAESIGEYGMSEEQPTEHDHLAEIGLSFDDIVAFWQAFAAREDDYTKNHNQNWTRD